jgi:hypothetical protein
VKIAKNLSTIVFPIAVATFIAEPAWACPTTASYHSVVVNSQPERLSAEVMTFKVRVDAAYYSSTKGEIQGLAGTLLEDRRDYLAGTKFQIKVRLLSMCDTWVDTWSDDHNIDAESKLTGYVTGKVATPIIDGTLVIQPVLFQRAADRDWSEEPSRAEGRAPYIGPPNRMKIDPQGTWKTLKVNADDLASNLSETNRQIRDALDKE